MICIKENSINILTTSIISKCLLRGCLECAIGHLNKQCTSLSPSTANIEVIQSIMIYVYNSHPGAFLRDHMRDERLNIKINKIIFLMPPFDIYLVSYIAEHRYIRREELIMI